MDETQKKAIEEKLLHEINSTQKKIEEYTELCKPIAPEDEPTIFSPGIKAVAFIFLPFICVNNSISNK